MKEKYGDISLSKSASRIHNPISTMENTSFAGSHSNAGIAAKIKTLQARYLY